MKGLKLDKKGKFIRIKVKHILMGLAIVFIFIPNLIIGISYTIFDMNWRVTNKEIPASFFTQGFLNIYVKMPKLSPFEDIAYYIMGKNYYKTDTNNFIITREVFKNIEPQYSSYKGLENAILCHEKAIKGKNSEIYYNKNAQALIELYHIKGDIEGAKAIVEQMKNSASRYTKNLGYLNESILFVKLQDYDKALFSLNKLEEDYKKKGKFDFYRYLGQIYMLKGEEKLAKEAFYKSLNFSYGLENRKSIWQELNYEKIYFKDFYYRDYLIRDNEYKKLLEKRKKVVLENIVSAENRGDVKGYFIIDGMPMEGALIKLIPQGGGIYTNDDSKEYPYEITTFSYVDKKGEFYFNNVPEGIYEVNIVLPYYKALNSGLELIDNTKQGRMVFIANYLEVVSKKNLEEGKEYNEKYIVISDNKKYLRISDNKNIFNEKYDEDEEANKEIKLREEGNKIILSTTSNHNFERDILGVDVSKYFAKGQSVELSKNFLLEEFNVDTSISSKFKSAVNLNNIVSIAQYFIEEMDDYSSIKISYNEKEKEYIKNDDFEGLLKYYEGLYEKGNRDIDMMERLIKLYVLGVDNLGNGKNVNKAIELNEELKEITKSETIYTQIKRYITIHNQIEFYLEKDLGY
ncbi:tetratricopeptide repeat protein [Clostridium massiliamazoniense]|uniref:tetratricopeptide repeat protein n=1 Tax=Clostridium massiliamazoniense TaxID=1347366 RepID=UPI0006D78570|nr:hypothetical protein [Clostridium massiliamazoniense]